MKSSILRTAADTLIQVGLLGLSAQIAVGTAAMAQSNPTTSSQLPRLMDRQEEIAMALSACPSSVAPKAAVYVLDKSGYIKVRDSQNGFTAIVQHSLPTTQEPQCMDEEGAKTLLPRMMMVAELRTQGKVPEEIRAAISAAFAKGSLKPPTRVGIDYMLSAQNMVPATCDGLRPLHDQCRYRVGRPGGRRTGIRRRRRDSLRTHYRPGRSTHGPRAFDERHFARGRPLTTAALAPSSTGR